MSHLSLLQKVVSKVNVYSTPSPDMSEVKLRRDAWTTAIGNALRCEVNLIRLLIVTADEVRVS